MTELVLAVVVFVASHALPALRPLRRRLTDVLGERLYMALYSTLTLAVLVWLGFAYADAPYVEVWPVVEGLRWIPVVVMPFACILLVAGLTSPNPFSLGTGAAGYQPTRPGIVSVTRHPVLWALILWAAAHLPPNGDVASLILFGLFIVSALAGPPSLDAKRRSRLGDAAWAGLAAPTSNLPFAAIVGRRTRLDLAGLGAWRLAGGVVLYLVLYLAHAPVIGAAPLAS
jgi:uncharacterized membrane protein